MIATIPQLFDQIRHTLTEDVLSKLEATSWEASNLRSSLTLLTYLEDQVEDGAEVINHSVTAMRDLAVFIVQCDEASWISPLLREKLQATVASEYAGELVKQEANLRLQDHLSEILAAMPPRSLRSEPPDIAIADRVHQCLSLLRELEFGVAKRASGMPPF